MKRIKPWLIGTIAAALTLSIVVSVSAQGGPLGPSDFPVAFIGTVTDDAGEVAAGLAVEAYIGDGAQVCNDPATTYRADENGQQVTKYFVRVQSAAVQSGCGTDGDTVRFKIGDRWAGVTGTWTNPGILRTLNLTLAPEGPETVIIDVAVWRRTVDPVGALAISTRPPGGSWSRIESDEWPLEMSIPSGSSGRWERSEITPVDVTLADGSTVTIDVAVWRRTVDPVGALAISTRPPGGSWSRIESDEWPLEMSIPSGSSGRWERSEITPVEVELE